MPTLVPQVPSATFAVSADCAALTLSRCCCAGDGAVLGGWGEADAEADVAAGSSASEREISTGVLLPVADGDGFSSDSAVCERRCQRPRTPSTARRKLVEPVLKALVTASRAGASCWSSLSSWMPSVRRRPMSETTEGFSPQGWLRVRDSVSMVYFQ